MAVTSKTLRHTQRRARRSPAMPPLFAQSAFAITVLLAIVAVLLLGGALLGRLQVLADDIRYGRPRTYQMAGFVGHNEASGVPSYFVAMNVNRQVVIVELPGGDATQARTIQGPYLFGAREDLTPVVLSLQDADGDSHVDLFVDIRQERIVYLNRDGAFRLPTPDEQARIIAEHHQ